MFDEIHKYRQWCNYLKGLYDVKETRQKILVTGSGRLELYRFGGDSLQGRYHLLPLPALVGSPLSINALREDLRVSHKSVASWLDALERLYAIFRLAPFSAPRIRAVRKEQKHYPLDWSLAPEPAKAFEDLVAKLGSFVTPY